MTTVAAGRLWAPGSSIGGPLDMSLPQDDTLYLVYVLVFPLAFAEHLYGYGRWRPRMR